ncbi:MAG: hypothetical protein ACFFBI_03950 [Promethearchaeota archaeon]
MIKILTYSAAKMHPNVKKIAPMHIFIEFFINVSLFFKNEKKIKKGIREPMIKIIVKNKIGILNMSKITIIGKRMIPA